MLGGLGVLAPRTRRPAGVWLIALLAAVFPANLYMAREPERFERVPRWALYARLPLQPLMMCGRGGATRDCIAARPGRGAARCYIRLREELRSEDRHGDRRRRQDRHWGARDSRLRLGPAVAAERSEEDCARGEDCCAPMPASPSAWTPRSTGPTACR